MCIICDCGEDGEKFLRSFEQASTSMAEAARLMLRCSADNAGRKRRSYDRTHKKMVKLIKDWNRLEHEREVIFYSEIHPNDTVTKE